MRIKKKISTLHKVLVLFTKGFFLFLFSFLSLIIVVISFSFNNHAWASDTVFLVMIRGFGPFTSIFCIR